MSFNAWLLFAGTETVLCLTPGPAVLFVLSYGLACGGRASLWASAGVLAGNACYFALSALGRAAACWSSRARAWRSPGNADALLDRSSGAVEPGRCCSRTSTCWPGITIACVPSCSATRRPSHPIIGRNDMPWVLTGSCASL